MGMVVIIMGVSGTGKTTIGKMVSQALSVDFVDADDFHPKSNIEKMRSGKPLNDQDRLPWLKILSNLLLENEKKGIVLACSALKENYREILSSRLSKRPFWIHLTGSKELLLQRMSERNHFMPQALLQSQLDTLETPKYACELMVDQAPSTICEQIVDYIHLKGF